ncbi:phospholipase D1/2 [Poseidonocella sedimentorum]|uniref:Phospholipase D n=1 Tax=Poseidonocella sedimentorum TaxID=871652 RepID=A0A1I6DT15_9RHOB|nr:phospholipase D1/2 [Poseidonocella sedimentorum]
MLVTAEDAYPVLERAFLGARQEVIAGFRIFDPETRLRSDESRAIGETWMDLLAHTLERGVRITLLIGDFDPVNALELHRGTWAAIRRLSGLRELVSPGSAPLVARAMLHPAQIGLIPRLVFGPRARGRIRAMLADGLDPGRQAPGLIPWCKDTKDGPRLRPFALPRQYPASHHHKLAVFDRERLYIGGLDLNNRRYDTHAHDQPTQKTWHDVQLMLGDRTLAEAGHRYLESLAETVAGAKPPPPVPGFLRSQSQPRRFGLTHISPRPALREIRAAHLREIARAERLIYLETQFFRDRVIARALCRAARRTPDLTLIMTLPGAPEDVAFHGSGSLDSRFGENLQARCVTKVLRAFGPRVFFGAPVQPRPVRAADSQQDRARLAGAPLVYVHAKVSIFDRRAAIVSSANLNGRSLNWDSEAGVILHHPEDVAQVQRKVMRHWLPETAGPEFLDPQSAHAAWAALARENAAGEAGAQRGFIVPYRVAPARRFGRPVPGAPEAMV